MKITTRHPQHILTMWIQENGDTYYLICIEYKGEGLFEETWEKVGDK